VKCYASEISLRLIGEAMQVLGGVGYTCDYPIEQYMRDSKILTIWEGTSFMHANDLVGRKMRMKDGIPFKNWLSVIGDFIRSNGDAAGFEKEMKILSRAYDCVLEVKNIFDAWYGNFQDKKNLIPLYAMNALFICAQAQVAQCLMDQALVAGKRLRESSVDSYEKVYYEGKIMSARYYINQILPSVFGLTEIIRDADETVLMCPEGAFGAR